MKHNRNTIKNQMSPISLKRELFETTASSG